MCVASMCTQRVKRNYPFPVNVEICARPSSNEAEPDGGLAKDAALTAAWPRHRIDLLLQAERLDLRCS